MNASSNRRLYAWYGFLLFIIVVIVARLFYLQIIRHDYYQKAAAADQLKQYVIAPERGIIKAHQGSSVVPIVLNQKLYTLYADPTLVKNVQTSALKLSDITHGDASQYAELMQTKHSRYQILAKRLTEQQKTKITKLKLPGIGLQAQDYRIYPQGDLAAQILGFVDSDGQGRYGIEQQFNKQLAGKPGLLKAVTDASGVPLAANRDNVQIAPQPGSNFVLTIDMAVQRQLETALRQGLAKAGSQAGSALVINPNTGAIVAMANYPTYDPAKYYQVRDLSAFSNAAVSSPLEIGSIMKTLTVSAGLNQGVITPDTTYYDPGYVTIDGFTISNVEDISGPVDIKTVLRLSLNTGAVHIFKELGGGQFDKQGRDIWHDYMTNHFQLGKPTGIEQPNEAAGTIPDPDNGYGLDLRYANTTFGQGMTATILQMAAAFSSAINGGTYYRPHLVGEQIMPGGSIKQTKPQVVKQNVVKPNVSQEIQSLLEYVFTQNHGVYQSDLHPGYNIGGKTGTGQIAEPNGGGYKTGVYNGTFMGFVGGDRPQYVIAVLVRKPNLPGYESAGAQAAAPIFGKIADNLIEDYGVKPITH